ncbi:MAG TPA: hypothetical protein VK034_08540 [Enhygromyxa sp.]|nr:hypothetical protein [Enhygromyxa sp.]
MPDSLIAGLTDWPFAPGEGPFHVKGGSYRGHRTFVDQHVPGGFEQMVAQLDPALQKFYAQPFLASGWYDLAPLVAMAPVCGAALGISADEYVRKRSRLQVDQDIRGVYGFLAKLVSARTIARRLPHLIGLYFDFTQTITRAIEDHRVVTEHHGLPGPLAPWLSAVATAYIGRVLELTKAGEHRVVAGEFRPEGEAHGVSLVGFELEVGLAGRG